MDYQSITIKCTYRQDPSSEFGVDLLHRQQVYMRMRRWRYTRCTCKYMPLFKLRNDGIKTYEAPSINMKATPMRFFRDVCSIQTGNTGKTSKMMSKAKLMLKDER